MDQKTLLAVILSVVVLFTYNMISPKPKPSSSFNTQTTPAQQFKETTPQLNTTSISSSTVTSVASILSNPKLIYLENEHLKLGFSSVGGNLNSILFKKYNFKFPIEEVFSIDTLETANFRVESSLSNKIVFKFEDNQVAVEKSYTLDKTYLIQSNIKIHRKMSKQRFDVIAYKINSNTLDISIHPAEKSLLEYSIYSGTGIFRKPDAHKFDKKDENKYYKPFKWLGYGSRYFCFIFRPEWNPSTLQVSQKSEHELKFAFVEENSNAQEFSVDSLIYVGPQDLNLLKSFDAGFEEILSFKVHGFMNVMTFGMSDILAKLMLKGLTLFHHIFKNWGVSIILLAITIFLLTYPLTLKSMSSMKKMQSLQPEIMKLKELYKDNPQRLNKETMELYKSHKFNPFGGCLPVFLQMPVFVSLYQVLWRSYNLKGADFLWINDLSEADRLFTLPFTIPYIGQYFNILPLIVMVVMFIQQKMTMKSSVITDPDQLAQQKIMSNVLPLVIGFAFYNVASGLALYFVVFYVLSTFFQWKMSRKP